MTEFIMKAGNYLRKNKIFVLVFIFLVVTFFLYAKTVKYDFVEFDDTILVLENYDHISDYRNIPSFFYKSVFNTANDFFYRPVLTLSFAVDSMIMAKNSGMSHFTNAFLHFISALLLFILLRRLKFNETFSFLFTVVFIAHPAFVQAVAWIPGRNDTLLMVFVMCTLIFVFDYFNSPKRQTSKIIAAGFAFLAALMTKETAVALFVITPLFMYVFCPGVKKKEYAALLGAMIAIIAAYLALRAYSIGKAQKVFTLDEYILNIIYALKMYFGYIEYALMPWRISVIPEKMPMDIFTLLSAVLFFIPVAASLFFGIGRKKVVFFGLIWFIVLILPTLGMPINYWFSHRIYTASFGIVLIFIEFFEALSKKTLSEGKYLKLFLCLAAVLFSVVSFVNADKFKDKRFFLANAVNEQPDSDMVKIQLAGYYASIGDPRKALEALESVPPKEGMRYTLLYYESLGMVLSMLGRYDEAEEIFLQILDFYDDRENVNLMLSELYLATGRYDLSMALIEKLIKMQPKKEKYRLQYERILSKKTETES